MSDKVHWITLQHSSVIHCCKGNQLNLWKIGAPEHWNPWNDWHKNDKGVIHMRGIRIFYWAFVAVPVTGGGFGSTSKPQLPHNQHTFSCFSDFFRRFLLRCQKLLNTSRLTCHLYSVFIIYYKLVTEHRIYNKVNYHYTCSLLPSFRWGCASRAFLCSNIRISHIFNETSKNVAQVWL